MYRWTDPKRAEALLEIKRSKIAELEKISKEIKEIRQELSTICDHKWHSSQIAGEDDFCLNCDATRPEQLASDRS